MYVLTYILTRNVVLTSYFLNTLTFTRILTNFIQVIKCTLGSKCIRQPYAAVTFYIQKVTSLDPATSASLFYPSVGAYCIRQPYAALSLNPGALHISNPPANVQRAI